MIYYYMYVLYYMYVCMYVCMYVWCGQLPGIPVEKMVIEHAFVSNFKTPVMTATIHANPLTASMAGA